jgi:hypothetical protein
VANYYTTRFNPVDWPPSGGAIPAGVEWSGEEGESQGFACCEGAEIREASTQPLEERWRYRTTYRRFCPRHGDSELQVESHLDWISPNEYLLTQMGSGGSELETPRDSS